MQTVTWSIATLIHFMRKLSKAIFGDKNLKKKKKQYFLKTLLFVKTVYFARVIKRLLLIGHFKGAAKS